MAASVIYQPHDSAAVEEIPLVSFSQGKLTDLKNGIDDDNHSCFKVFKRSELQDNKKKNWRIVAARGQVMDYVGFNYGDRASKASATSKYLVGVLDKTTGKMKAYDAQLFNLKPWIVREENGPAPADIGNTPLSFREKSDRLTEIFGSKKMKRAMHSRLRNKVSEDSIQKTATIAAESVKDIPVALEVPGATTEFQILPPSNKDTIKTSEIYRLDDLLSESLLNDLEEKSRSLMEASSEEIDKWKTDHRYPSYILERLPISLRGDETSLLSLQQKASILVYMTILMQIFVSRKRVIESIPVLSEVPLSIKEHLCESFFQETCTFGGRTRRSSTKLTKNKIMIHLLLLALHIDGFETSLEPLQRDTAVSQVLMHQYVRSFGGKTRKFKDDRTDSTPGTGLKYMMELKGPLNIITRKTARPQRKKR